MYTLEKNNTSPLCLCSALNYTPSYTHVSLYVVWRVHPPSPPPTGVDMGLKIVIILVQEFVYNMARGGGSVRMMDTCSTISLKKKGRIVKKIFPKTNMW